MTTVFLFDANFLKFFLNRSSERIPRPAPAGLQLAAGSSILALIAEYRRPATINRPFRLTLSHITHTHQPAKNMGEAWNQKNIRAIQTTLTAVRTRLASR
jgi:hypothetical protein